MALTPHYIPPLFAQATSIYVLLLFASCSGKNHPFLWHNLFVTLAVQFFVLPTQLCWTPGFTLPLHLRLKLSFHMLLTLAFHLRLTFFLHLLLALAFHLRLTFAFHLRLTLPLHLDHSALDLSLLPHVKQYSLRYSRWKKKLQYTHLTVAIF